MISTVGKAYPYKSGWVIQTIRPPVPNLSDTPTVVWHDCRTISPEQRRKAWAIIGEIAAWAGYIGAAEKKNLHENFKIKFLMEQWESLQTDAIKRFSLGDCDMTTARLYIDWLVEFCIVNNVPTKIPLSEYAEDIQQCIYNCAIHKHCAVCGKKAELHHIDRVGMGRNRDEIDHMGMEALPLCREHHMEAHQHGDPALMEKYHLQPITIDEKICLVYRLKGKQHE